MIATKVGRKCNQKNGARARPENFCDWHRKDFSSPEECLQLCSAPCLTPLLALLSFFKTKVVTILITVNPEYFVRTQFSYPGLPTLRTHEISVHSLTSADSLACFVSFACILFSYGSRRVRNIRKKHAYEIFWIFFNSVYPSMCSWEMMLGRCLSVKKKKRKKTEVQYRWKR